MSAQAGKHTRSLHLAALRARQTAKLSPEHLNLDVFGRLEAFTVHDASLLQLSISASARY